MGAPLSNLIIDSQNRHVHKLRVSLLDACDMNCFYCIPEHNKFRPANQRLTANQIFDICSNLNKLGIDEIRLTGGEPLIHPDLLLIVEKLSTLDLKKLAITTNALKLKEILPQLKKTNCQHINISLDSLMPKQFEQITKSKQLNTVLESIFLAQSLGFNIKINMVLLKGINTQEIEDYVHFSEKYKLNIRFLELMKIGTARQYYEKHFFSADQAIEIIKTNNDLIPIDSPKDSTAFYFKTKSDGHIGFIASETKSFCSNCSRLRMDMNGKLRACLMKNDGINLKNIPFNEYPNLLNQIIKMKPMERISELDQQMNQVGG